MKDFLSRFPKNKKSDMTLVEYVMVAALLLLALRVGAQIIAGKVWGSLASLHATNRKYSQTQAPGCSSEDAPRR